MAAGDYPEVVMGNSFNASAVSQYAASGILVPIDEFINEKDTPNLWNMFEKHPQIKGANYLPDGHMYSLPQVKQYGPDYLERIIYINKVWLDKLNLEVPTTLDALKDVLRAFKTEDPNGNGKADEIPMTFEKGHAFSSPEMMLSSWGRATKAGVYDSYTTVKDGKVSYAPMTDEWREMVRFYRDLYAEGLLDMEAFTHTRENFTAKLQSKESIVGVAWSASNPMANMDEYIAIHPIAADGYEVVWQQHPGIIGNRNCFSITNACKNPKAVMKWIDHFFDIENSLQEEFGLFGAALNAKNAEGKYTWNEPPAGTSMSTFISENKPIASMPCYIPEEVFDEQLEKNASMLEVEEAYVIYEDYFTSEPWPRPYYTQEESGRLAELQTDIFSITDEKLAKWVVGTEDVETGWDAYVQALKDMGADELVKINQAAYDRFQDKTK